MRFITSTCKFSKLNSLIFNKVVIEFNSGKKVEIEKVDLELSEDEDRLKFRHESRMVETINHLLSISEKELISENIGSDDFRSNKQISSIINRLEKQVGYPSQFIKRSLIFPFFREVRQNGRGKKNNPKGDGCGDFVFPHL